MQQRLEAVQTAPEEQEDAVQLGPKSNVSLLDQHSRLKLEAEGNLPFYYMGQQECQLYDSIIQYYLLSYDTPQR